MMHYNTIDITGLTFNRLTVIGLSGRDKLSNLLWLCKCSCGNPEMVIVNGYNLRKGKTQSCGCIRKEKLSDMRKKYNTFKIEDDYVMGFIDDDIYFIVDIDDFEKINKYCWHLNNRGYVTTNIDGKKFLLHRFITNAKETHVVDHINHNKLNNRQRNLRLVTQSKNLMNRVTVKNNTSGTMGVHWHKAAKKWYAGIGVDGKNIYLGIFENKEEAIKIRKEAEEKYFGEFALDKTTFEPTFEHNRN